MAATEKPTNVLLLNGINAEEYTTRKGKTGYAVQAPGKYLAALTVALQPFGATVRPYKNGERCGASNIGCSDILDLIAAVETVA